MTLPTTEIWGWLAAIGSMLAFGTFGVPIKGEAARSVDVDPLVFQSYKTGMCLLTCWIVLLFGQEFSFTSWGIVSGLFWVPSGVAVVFAVKEAGLAVGIGVASSFIVMVSFVWGIIVFQEPVLSLFGSCCAVLLMIVGIFGMSYYSSPEAALPFEDDHKPQDNTLIQWAPKGQQLRQRRRRRQQGNSPFRSIVLSRRLLGICAAVFNGVWGGSIMVPMHFAPNSAKGIGYAISFAIGASIVTLGLWIGRLLFLSHRFNSVQQAYDSLPSFHLRKMMVPGGVSGLLWSIGNFFSMISVLYLGEGVGYSVIQAAMVVSGAWGIFYFQEVRGVRLRCLWFTSAFCTVSGIILLSYEHRTES